MTALVIKDDSYQAVRIPKELETEREEFIIKRVGKGYLLMPTDDPWFPLRLSIGQMPDNFMEDREEPAWKDITEREEF
ncbi:MAG: hypothetical protein IKN12_06860 [Selenomonadaceae bacterium]|nr:hypothetical protein [Selenomonadaceae bacterium]MBR3722472.1 hypothetical protein [Selenomonadaceae bacterium]